jgi:arylformamidase
MSAMQRTVLCLLVGVPAALSSGCLFAARQVYRQVSDHREEQSIGLEDSTLLVDPTQLPADIRIVRDVAYGDDPLRRFDVYAPQHAKDAPVIFMVHGGGWYRGDKSMRNVVENKVKRWVPRGFIVISVNNRLVPAADPVEQARDVARALARAQHDAASWGGDPTRFILMGHSAGAHLVALVSASDTIRNAAGDRPWLGSVLLDSGALDVPKLMQAHHVGLFDRAFGHDPIEWKAASPYDALTRAEPPILAVCSSQRRNSCSEAARFVSKAASTGTRATSLPEDLSHGDINARLGTDGAYTDAVESFMGSVDVQVARRLAAPAPAPALPDVAR